MSVQIPDGTKQNVIWPRWSRGMLQDPTKVSMLTVTLQNLVILTQYTNAVHSTLSTQDGGPGSSGLSSVTNSMNELHLLLLLSS